MWVHDLERMSEFYVSLGGLAGGLYHNPRTRFTSRFVAFGDGCRLELMHQIGLPPRCPAPAMGLAHLALSVGDRAAVDAAVDRLRQRGVPVASAPRQTGDGYYEAVVEDPEGNLIELTTS